MAVYRVNKNRGYTVISRFSRDYIETGNYLECTFPFMGVRFISVNDGYDSEDYKGTTGDLEVVMRSICRSIEKTSLIENLRAE